MNKPKKIPTEPTASFHTPCPYGVEDCPICAPPPPTASKTWEELGTITTAIDPKVLDDSMYIKREDFIKKYGKAAERLLAEECASQLSRLEAGVRGMIWNTELDNKYDGEEIRRKIHNQALSDVLALIKKEEK